METAETANLRKTLVDQYLRCETVADRLRMEFDHIWREIDKHPFLLEIEKGKLPVEKYRTYALQNYIYFLEFFRNTGLAASKARTLTAALEFRNRTVAKTSEYEKYIAVIRQVGITDAEISQVTVDPTIPLPAARAYTDYQYKIYSTGSPGEMAAAVLPCAWSYSPRDRGGLDCAMRVARGLSDHYGVDKRVALSYGNYADEEVEMRGIVSLKRAISEEVEREGQDAAKRIRDVFRRSSEYEYVWWELAYRHEPGKERKVGSFF